jgi:uncharacterized protein (DUF39 family)
MLRSIEEINQKIRRGQVVVATAEEIIDSVHRDGVEATATRVDVVTTGTFSPMCSSGVFLNVGHANPKIKLGGGKAYLNDVPAYTGLAAVDLFLGANALPDDDPRNKIYPGEFRYGGGHVIEDLVAGKDLKLVATAYGTDCYPRKKLETWISLKDMNNAIMFNVRNAYQNYAVAVNTTDRIMYTYMGVLKPHLGNANYATAGQLSPLLNDPCYRSTGIGTRIFLGGGTGFVSWHGTQHNPTVPRTPSGVPTAPAGTLALIGDLKQMKPEWLVGTSMLGYGSTLSVGIGVPIPILSEQSLKDTAVTDADITAPVIDYSSNATLAEVTHAQLRSGRITLQGKEVPTSSLSSYLRAREIANTLKQWIQSGEFLLTEPVAPLPGPESGMISRPLRERPLEE